MPAQHANRGDNVTRHDAVPDECGGLAASRRVARSTIGRGGRDGQGSCRASMRVARSKTVTIS
ncbi:MAG: hypothetical protein WAL16_17195, partial [Streptosporangiaceae bacterium]